jgi:hypothetical protein
MTVHVLNIKLNKKQNTHKISYFCKIHKEGKLKLECLEMYTYEVKSWKCFLNSDVRDWERMKRVGMKQDRPEVDDC